MIDVVEVLRACPLFAGFPDVAISEAAPHARVRRFGKNEAVYEKGEPQVWLCVIASGMVRIHSVNAQGREAMLIVLDQGAWVGDAVFAPGAGRVYGATAHTDAEIVELPGEFFRGLMARYPQSYPVVLDCISRRLWSAMTLIEEDALRGTLTRIGRRLLFLCDIQRGGGKAGAGPVTIALTREHIANMMGMTRQGVHQTLKRFQEEGLIELGYGFITVTDEQALSAFLDTSLD
ncbi:MAG: Crp/Fnr family transcriptional regulator [Alcanivorax sediminis]|uniref:Crp/Fnr family transcriptional regulator n=1 Tax=Alcanivorax sediminis TaxID=2663008 RepID=UPI003C48C34F